jgi:hypothetical protein
MSEYNDYDIDHINQIQEIKNEVGVQGIFEMTLMALTNIHDEGLTLGQAWTLMDACLQDFKPPKSGVKVDE